MSTYSYKSSTQQPLPALTAQEINDIMTGTVSAPKLNTSSMWNGTSSGGGGAGAAGQAMTGSVWTTNTSGPYTVGSINTATGISGIDNFGLAKFTKDGIEINEAADLKIGNQSLKDFMTVVSQRLAMLVPNPAMEKEWEELRTLGEAYRALEKECIDKSKVWDILNK